MAGEKFDFLTPFFRAAIVTDPNNREETRHPLWTTGNPELYLRYSGEGKHLTSLAFLSDITVKLNLAYLPTITATLTPPFEAGRYFVESDLVEFGTSIIEVEFGYAGKQASGSPKFEALLVKAPEVSIGTDFSITLNAEGLGGFAAQRGASGTPEKDVSLEQVFKKIADKYGMTLDDDDLGGKERTLFREKRKSIVSGHISDWYFMVREATEIGCWVYHTMVRDPKPPNLPILKIIPVDKAIGSSPEYTFRMFDYPTGKLDPSTGEMPILGISTPTSAIYLSGMTQKLRMMGTNSKTRERVDITADDKSTAIKRTDDKQTGPKGAFDKMFQEGTLLPVDAGKSDSQKKLDSTFQEVSSNMGVRVEVQTVGLPNLVPGMVIAIDGVAKNRIDGKYAVFEVTHSLGTGGFTTSFTAVSNVAQLSSRLNGAKRATNPNTSSTNTKAPDATMARTKTFEVPAKLQEPVEVNLDFLKKLRL